MKLPKTVYINIGNKGDKEEEFLNANIKADRSVEDDGPTEVGIYRLERIVIVKKVLQVKP